MKIGYARVFTYEQNLDLQRQVLEAAGCKVIYEDKGISRATTERQGLTKALSRVNEGDILVVWKLDRLGRSLARLIHLIDGLGKDGAGFQSLTEGVDTTIAGGQLIFQMMGALAEFERSLIDKRTPAGEMALIYRERLSLVFHSLLSANYQQRWYKVGMRQVLNRLFMLFQEPIVILLLELQPPSSGGHHEERYRILHHTLLDPLWRDHFEETLLKIPGVSKDGKYLYIASTNTFRARILPFLVEEDICLCFFRITTQPDAGSRKPGFSPFEKDKLFFFLRTLSKPSPYHERLAEHVLSRDLLKYLREKQPSHWKDGRIVVPDPPDLSFSDVVDTALFNKHYEAISSIFDIEYRRIFSSPLLSENNRNPPNILFFIKQYNIDKMRFRGWNSDRPACYSHGIRVIIPPKQRIHIARALENLADHQNTTSNTRADNQFFFPVETLKENGHSSEDVSNKLESNKLFNDGNGDDSFFWEEIKTEEGRSRILNIMSASFGLQARSISDPVLATGYVHIKHDPFAKGGKNRLESSVWEKGMQGGNEPDYRRIVYFHYVLSMMAPRAGKLSAMMVPGHVGGSPWCCITFLFKRSENDHDTWLDNYHFYHSICHYVVRGIRGKIKRLYLRSIGDIYTERQKPLIDKFVEEGEIMSDKIESAINPHLHALSRIYPFPYIQFRALDTSRVNGNEEDLGNADFIQIWLRSYDFAVTIIDNPFFRRHLEGVYLEKEEVIEVLDKADHDLQYYYQLCAVQKESNTKPH